MNVEGIESMLLPRTIASDTRDMSVVVSRSSLMIAGYRKQAVNNNNNKQHNMTTFDIDLLVKEYIIYRSRASNL